jgi:hypothetical protein
MTLWKYTAVLLFVLCLFSGSGFISSVGSSNPAPLFPANKLYFGPNVANNSTRWGGYAINESQDSITSVQGSWTQPSVKCNTKSEEQIEAAWVGIDGLNTSTVEQTGTIAECILGTAYYSAWYEFYPSPTQIISTITVTPGNSFTANVTYSTSTNEFTITINDTTTGQSFTTASQLGGAERSSAEWIVEPPTENGAIVPLADFGKIAFTGCTAESISHSGKIGSFGSTVLSFNIVSEKKMKTMESTSALMSGGSKFTATWKSVGP